MSQSTVSSHERESSGEGQAAAGITAIEISGFKSLVNNRMEIRPLTILAGANSSGKSSIIQPLLLLKQTLDATYDPGPLLLDGPNVRFTSAEQFLAKQATRTSAGFSISLESGIENTIEFEFGKAAGSTIDIMEMRWRWQGQPLALRRNMMSNEIFSEVDDSTKSKLFPFKLYESAGIEASLLEVTRNRCFLVPVIELKRLGPPPLAFMPSTSTVTSWEMDELFRDSVPFHLLIRSAIHVPGLRGNPERTYKTTAVGSSFSGTFETYVASIVNHWKRQEPDRLAGLASWLRQLGLTWKVDAQSVDETQVELRVGRLLNSQRGGARDLVNIADVGFGVSQVLPVLVALLAAEPGQLVYVEEPELHLHPRAQVALARVLADAAQRGVRVVAETHSQLLLLGIQTLVAKGELDPGLIKLHWFQRDAEGVTAITSSDVDEKGAYGDWPEDFADVSLKAESDFLDAATFCEGVAHGT